MFLLKGFVKGRGAGCYPEEGIRFEWRVASILFSWRGGGSVCMGSSKGADGGGDSGENSKQQNFKRSSSNYIQSHSLELGRRNRFIFLWDWRKRKEAKLKIHLKSLKKNWESKEKEVFMIDSLKNTIKISWMERNDNRMNKRIATPTF